MLSKPILPFNGNKGKHIKKIIKLLKENYDENEKYYVFDVFGGSGIISHNIKKIFPNWEVIYNDFDWFIKRIEDIEKTNELIQWLREKTKEIKHDQKLNEELKNEIIEYLESKKPFDEFTILNMLLFSHNYSNTTFFEEAKKKNFYNHIIKTNYEVNDYLKDVQIVHQDYKDLINENENKYEKTIWILDPPYCYSDKSHYKKNYFKLVDTLNILKFFKDVKSVLLFEGVKSEAENILNFLYPELECEKINLNENEYLLFKK